MLLIWPQGKKSTAYINTGMKIADRSKRGLERFWYGACVCVCGGGGGGKWCVCGGGEGKSTGDGEEREKENRTIDKIKGARTTRRGKGKMIATKRQQ
jgi:hypothetical protein